MSDIARADWEEEQRRLASFPTFGERFAPVVPGLPQTYASAGQPYMDQFRFNDDPNQTWRAYDKAAAREDAYNKLPTIPGKPVGPAWLHATPSGQEAPSLPQQIESDKALASMFVPTSIPEAGLMAATGGTGKALGKLGASVLGAGGIYGMTTDEAQAAKLPQLGGVVRGVARPAAMGVENWTPIKAYHSSPHDFERFDLSKIGTGEGAQVYGHGLYFAENPKVSGQGGEYWNQFKNRFAYSPAEMEAVGVLQNHDFDRARAIAELEDSKKYDAGYIGGATNSFDRAKREAIVAKNHEALDLLKSGKPIGPRTYEVNIHARPEQMLDWDKPLGEQSAAVRGLLQQATSPQSLTHALPRNAEKLGGLAQGGAVIDQSHGLINRPSGGVVGKGMGSVVDQSKVGNPVVGLSSVDVVDILGGKQGATNVGGKDASMVFAAPPTKRGDSIAMSVSTANPSSGGIAGVPAEGSLVGGGRGPVKGFPAIPADQLSHMTVQDFLGKFPDRKSAAEALGGQGISGIRYLDQGSRAAGEGSRNFVIFDPGIIEIAKKYGIPGMLGAGALGETVRQDRYNSGGT